MIKAKSFFFLKKLLIVENYRLVIHTKIILLLPETESRAVNQLHSNLNFYRGSQ